MRLLQSVDTLPHAVGGGAKVGRSRGGSGTGGTAYAGSDGGAGEAATGAGVTATRTTWWPMVTELRMKVPLELEGGRGGA